MLIPEVESASFLATYRTLCAYVAGELGGIHGITDPGGLLGAGLEEQSDIRDAVFDHPDLIERFCDENPMQLPPDTVVQVRAWRHVVRGQFFVERDLKKHTVFLDSKSPSTAYGVLGLTTEIIDMLPFAPPTMIEATLLPWKHTIICDGLIRSYNITMGSGMRRSLRETYSQAKARGVVTSLDPDRPAPVKKSRAQPKTPAIERLLKRCPRTVPEFIDAYGEPKMRMTGAAALERCPWSVDGRPTLDIDELMVYGNIIRDRALHVYSKNGAITHLLAADQMTWARPDRKPHAGRRLMS